MNVNGYTFDETHPIGNGGMGCVYKGTAPNGETVAIKMMDNKYCFDPYVRQCFYNEVESLKGLHHPSVVGIRGHAFKDGSGNLYMPMELVDGETIQQRVGRNGPFNEADARNMMSKILKAFEYIHGENKVHRDIKPSNIMIRPNGEICVIDFGIVKDMNTSTGHTVGTIVGTDGYMSPEQVTATDIDHRTDIYSLGCLLHYMLTGKHAILKKNNNNETKMSILNDAFPSAKQMRPELSDDIQDIIFKAVDKDMTRRYQTAEEFEQAISGRTRVVGAYVTVGRDGRCDIVFDDMGNKDVSRRHLTIRYKHMCDEPIIEIEDDSTNGTGIDGKRLLHKGSESFRFDLSKVTVRFNYGGQEAEVLYLDGVQRLPEVYLAAKAKYRLDWDEVFVKLHERIPNEFAKESGDPPPPPPQPTDDKLSTGLGILSFLFPLVGWILSSTMKKTSPKAAKSAGELGWIGFFVGLVFLLIIIFSN